MNKNLVIELVNTIKNLKIEILKKQEHLSLLIEQYQKIISTDENE